MSNILEERKKEKCSSFGPSDYRTIRRDCLPLLIISDEYEVVYVFLFYVL